MSREIKFRAFHKPSKIMYWFDIMWGNNGHGNGWIGMTPFGEEMTIKSYRDNITNIAPDDCEIMQFTGLKDKKGVEIYEGDIIGGYPHGTVEVKWNDEYACFEAVWIDVEYDESGEYYEKEISSLFANELHNCNDAWEVIGNIHQNPELL